MKKMTCRALVVSLLALSFQTARAGMIGAEQAAPGAAQTDRGRCSKYLSPRRIVGCAAGEGSTRNRRASAWLR